LVDKVESLCAEFGIEIVPGNVYPKPGQTRALATIRRIIARHGEGHARLVLSTLAETAANQGLIDQVSLWACSDLVLACSDWVENHAEEWFEAWDEVPLGWVMWRCQELSPAVKQRHALVGMMYLLLTQHREARGADRKPQYEWLRRVRKAEEVRGKTASYEPA
jgi:hypothetical protein